MFLGNYPKVQPDFTIDQYYPSKKIFNDTVYLSYAIGKSKKLNRIQIFSKTIYSPFSDHTGSIGSCHANWTSAYTATVKNIIIT